MLRFNKKRINAITFFIMISIFILFVSFVFTDIYHLIKAQEIHYGKITKMEIPIKDVYAEMLKQFEEDSKEKEIEKLTNIDIYSTNPWRIIIPKLRLDAPISEGTTAESMRRTVGHFEETPKWKGNVALAGHNRGYRCNFFQEIKNLQKGDIIIYCTELGQRKYKVVVNTIIKETNWNYIENTKDNRLTLITCETGKRDYRRCIQAVEIEAKK